MSPDLEVTMSNTVSIHVSPEGSDAGAGTEQQPFATLERAREAIREMRASASGLEGGVTVWIHGGTYRFSRPLHLEATDGGSADAPIVYRSCEGEEVRLTGGAEVTEWERVTDPEVLERIDEAVRPHILQADLRAQGISDYGSVESAQNWSQSSPGIELFFDDRPMTLARWPNAGEPYARIAGFPGGTKPYVLRGRAVPDSSEQGRFLFDGDRPRRWGNEKNLMLHGYWFFDWADQRSRVASIDADNHVIELDSGVDYRFGFRKGQWYYAYNALCELDRPGEWYLDRDRGILYFWPPPDASPGRATVSVLPGLISMRDVSYVTFRGLTFEATRQAAIEVSRGSGVSIAGCVVRNTGGWGIEIRDGTNHRVIGCDLYGLGDGGIILEGGDRTTLTPAGHAVENCHIHHYARWNPMYKPAIQLGGVGNRVAHCLIHDAPHSGIAYFRGNDHVIEFNEFHSLVYHANDAGVLGLGRDWTQRGNVIRFNWVHDCYGQDGRGCKAIHLDDCTSGIRIFGNVFERLWCEQGRGAITVHGGRDNVIENNLFLDCLQAVRVHKFNFPPTPLYENLQKVPHTEPPWSDRYPPLAAILDDEPVHPKGNVIARNVVAGGEFLSTDFVAAPLVSVRGNLTGCDPRIERSLRGVPSLADDSPAWALGFEPIPVDRIGLYEDDHRASWPVEHEVRPAPPMAQRQSLERSGGNPRLVVRRLEGQGPAGTGLASLDWPADAVAVGETPARGQVEGEPASMRVAHDGEKLYVRVGVPGVDSSVLNPGEIWGRSDGVEISLRDASISTPAPTCILRGFPTGDFVASQDAGMHPEDTHRVERAVNYTAGVAQDEWAAEWVLPFTALDIAASAGIELGFNCAVWRRANEEWLVWAGTTVASWILDGAGVIVLE